MDLLTAMRFAGRDRLPAWVVRMRSVLDFMMMILPVRSSRVCAR
jgi:hypothetical protein